MTRVRHTGDLRTAKRGAGRQHGEINARNDFARHVAALMRTEEQRLKALGVWAYRKEAQPGVRAKLIEEGYDREFVEGLNLMNTRPRGKRGGP